MKIDISRVNLLEKDIEDWLYENPGAIPPVFGNHSIERWIGRQYQLPSGIADLVGIRDDDMVAVVEVKNVPINKAAVLQVCRYANDIKHILSNRMNYPHYRDWHEPIVDMVLFGPSIDVQTFIEAQSIGIRTVCFSTELSLVTWLPNVSHEQRREISDQQDEIAKRPEWSIFGLTAQEQVEMDLGREFDKGILLPPREGDGYSDIILVENDGGE